MKRTFFATLVAVFTATAFHASADEYNRRPHLDPKIRAKVSRAIAKSWLERGHGAESHVRVGSGKSCGSQVVGDFSDDESPPREVVIVAKDVININQYCRR
jgi:hypothetical protein